MKINLIELSMQQTDALSVLLTGRSNTRFAHLIQRMVNTRKLSFDIICLKPEIGPQNQNCSTTNHFKQSFLESLVRTYSKAEEIRVYEDRPKQYAFVVHVGGTVLMRPVSKLFATSSLP